MKGREISTTFKETHPLLIVNWLKPPENSLVRQEFEHVVIARLKEWCK